MAGNAETIAEGGKYKRKMLAHYLNATPGSDGTATYERLGKDLTEFLTNLNPNVTTTNNILNETTTEIDSYQPSSEVTTYYARKGSKLHEHLQDLIDRRATLSDLETDYVEVHTWDGTSGAYKAFKTPVVIELVSYGGDTTGIQIPFTLHENGERISGTWNEATNTFTPDDDDA